MALTGLFAAGVCNADSVSALASFSSQYPQIQNGSLVSLSGVQIDVAGHVFGSVVLQNLVTGAYIWTWLDTPLIACDPLLNPSIFAIPQASDVATVWSFAFVTPMIIYLVAWAFSSITAMFRTRPSDEG
ncbi:MAG: hypothetical protein PHG89_11660 [Gallionella sp.]|nr:hypothetical protein [Gallionella sp.]